MNFTPINDNETDRSLEGGPNRSVFALEKAADRDDHRKTQQGNIVYSRPSEGDISCCGIQDERDKMAGKDDISPAGQQQEGQKEEISNQNADQVGIIAANYDRSD
ncbi:MAG TPA: hypothetical protein VMC09_05155 [Anaerolineales bacterium]|nr:hypothetical protein [Anaerolineales bacterium]